MRAPVVVAVVLAAACGERTTAPLALRQPPLPPVPAFERLQLTGQYFAEGACVGDFGHDDVASGPVWYAGPAFDRVRAIFPPVAFPVLGYADVLFAFAEDVDRDGWTPALVEFDGDGSRELLCASGGYLGCLQRDAANPTAPWTPHRLSAAPQFGAFTHGLAAGDVDGDGRTDIVVGNKKGALVFRQR